jgi:four helix bundle protein
VRELRPLVPAIKKFDRDLADQITRAGTSVMLNLGEGRRRRGGDQRRVVDVAPGSAREGVTARATADAWGWIVDARKARAVLDRLLALLWRLVHGRPALSPPA